MDLSDRDREILDFEAGPWWKSQGAKEAEIFRRWQLTPAQFYQIRNALIFTPAAYVYQPQAVRRLRTQIELDGRQRVSRGIDS